MRTAIAYVETGPGPGPPRIIRAVESTLPAGASRERVPRRPRARDRLAALGARAARDPRAPGSLAPDDGAPVPPRARRAARAADAADAGLVGGRRPAAAVQRHAGTRTRTRWHPAAGSSTFAAPTGVGAARPSGSPTRPSSIAIRDAGVFEVADGPFRVDPPLRPTRRPVVRSARPRGVAQDTRAALAAGPDPRGTLAASAPAACARSVPPLPRDCSGSPAGRSRRNGRRILFTSDSRADLSGNLKLVYDRMVARGLDREYELLTLVQARASPTRRSLRDRIRLPWLLARADAIVIDDFQPVIYRVDVDRDVRIVQLWHASGAFKTVGYSRIGKPGGPRPWSRIHKNYTHAIVSSDDGRPVLRRGVRDPGVARRPDRASRGWTATSTSGPRRPVVPRRSRPSR